jgi:hypothetical protein
MSDGNISSTTPNFTSSVNDFDLANVIAGTDRLIVLPVYPIYTQNYIGNWTIIDVVGQTLDFDEAYNGQDKSGLDYVIGNEKRWLSPNDFYLADITALNGNYLTDATGRLQLVVKYDLPLAGHTFTLGAYGEENNRTGISSIETFRSNDFSSTTERIEGDGTVQTANIQLGISGGTYPLSNITIDASSIELIGISGFCTIVSPDLTFTTDFNGYISVDVEGESGTAGCSVGWDKTSSSIYKEY